MWKKVLVGIAALVAVLLIVVSLQPVAYHVERSTVIAAPAEVVWAQVSDFSVWNTWSPWQKDDPTQKTTVKGEAGAVGHSSSWEGEKTGTGTMTIVSVDRPHRLEIKMEFVTPMTGVATVTFDIEQSEGLANVTWSLDGKNDFIGKAVSLFMDVDEKLGPKYEQGLVNLKTLGEAEAKQQARARVKTTDETPAE